MCVCWLRLKQLYLPLTTHHSPVTTHTPLTLQLLSLMNVIRYEICLINVYNAIICSFCWHFSDNKTYSFLHFTSLHDVAWLGLAWLGLVWLAIHSLLGLLMCGNLWKYLLAVTERTFTLCKHTHTYIYSHIHQINNGSSRRIYFHIVFYLLARIDSKVWVIAHLKVNKLSYQILFFCWFCVKQFTLRYW